MALARPTFGVPLLGDAFTEGMARVAQRLCAGDDINVGLPPVKAEGIVYYTALYRFLRSRFPNADPALLTLVLCDAALCSRTPGRTFGEAISWLDNSPMPTSVEGYWTLREDLDGALSLPSSRTFILERIHEAEDGLPPDHQFGQLYKHLLAIFRRAWTARQGQPAVFLDASYREDFLVRVLHHLGAPPVVFEDRDHIRRLSVDAVLEQACHAFRSTYDVLLSLTGPAASECTLLRSKACAARKVAACRSNVLAVPIPSSRKACAMVFAATQLALHQRKVRWI